MWKEITDYLESMDKAVLAAWIGVVGALIGGIAGGIIGARAAIRAVDRAALRDRIERRADLIHDLRKLVFTVMDNYADALLCKKKAQEISIESIDRDSIGNARSIVEHIDAQFKKAYDAMNENLNEACFVADKLLNLDFLPTDAIPMKMHVLSIEAPKMLKEKEQGLSSRFSKATDEILNLITHEWSRNHSEIRRAYGKKKWWRFWDR